MSTEDHKKLVRLRRRRLYGESVEAGNDPQLNKALAWLQRDKAQN